MWMSLRLDLYKKTQRLDECAGTSISITVGFDGTSTNLKLRVIVYDQISQTYVLWLAALG